MHNFNHISRFRRNYTVSGPRNDFAIPFHGKAAFTHRKQITQSAHCLPGLPGTHNSVQPKGRLQLFVRTLLLGRALLSDLGHWLIVTVRTRS